MTFQPQIIYGAFDNTQIEIQGDLMYRSQHPRRREQVRRPAPGPALQLQYRDVQPAGLGRAGRGGSAHRRELERRGYAITGILTRSFGRLRAHLNAGYTILGSPQGQERPGAYRAVAAVSYPLGYPTSFRDTLIASLYTRQSDLRGQRNNTGVEVGLRHQLTSRMVLDAGLGTEFAGPADRAALLGTVGLSVGF